LPSFSGPFQVRCIMTKIPKEIKWLDKYKVGEDDDVNHLEAAAANNEFVHGHKREDAEAKAHADYLGNKALDSAAHHYLGMRAALAGKNEQAARQHGEAYAKAMDHLKLSPHDEPPQAVKDRVEHLKQKVYSFKSHPADALL
jgi:hypothetical protein